MTNTKLFLISVSIICILFGCSKKKSETLYRISDGRSYGFIDSTGKIVIPVTLSFTSPFQQDLALLFDEKSETDRYFFINRKGDTVLNPIHSILNTNPGNMYHYYKTRVDLQDYNNALPFITSEYSFSSGLALICDDKSELFGYMNKKGEIVIQPQFKNAIRFYNGYAVVQTAYDSINWENTRVGMIDSTGKMVIPAKYYSLTPLSYGLTIGTIATKQGEGYGFSSFLLNKKGDIINTVLPGYFCFFNSFSGGYAAVHNGIMQTFYKTPYCIIDSTGTILKHNGKEMYFEDLIINRGKYFWFKRNGKYAWFTLDKKGFVNMVDNKVYDSVKAGFNNAGIASVRFTSEVGGPSRYGYIDTLGNFVLPAKYHNAIDFRGPLAGAQLKSGNVLIDGYINMKGIFVWSREIRDSD